MRLFLTPRYLVPYDPPSPNPLPVSVNVPPCLVFQSSPHIASAIALYSSLPVPSSSIPQSLESSISPSSKYESVDPPAPLPNVGVAEYAKGVVGGNEKGEGMEEGVVGGEERGEGDREGKGKVRERK